MGTLQRSGCRVSLPRGDMPETKKGYVSTYSAARVSSWPSSEGPALVFALSTREFWSSAVIECVDYWPPSFCERWTDAKTVSANNDRRGCEGGKPALDHQ